MPSDGGMPNQSTIQNAGTVTHAAPSTVLNPGTTIAGGGGVPAIDAGEDSIPSILEGEFARIKSESAAEEAALKAKGDDAAKDAKAKVDEKALKAKEEPKPERQRGQGGKFAKAQPEGDAEVEGSTDGDAAAGVERAGVEGEQPRQSEGRGRHAEAPARFLPEARARWANVPNEVKAEFHRVQAEMEGEITRHKASAERYEQFRRYDEMAKANGRDFATDSLPKILQFESMMRSNPLMALDYALKEAGPRRQDGSPLSLVDVIQYVAQNPQALAQAQRLAQGQQGAGGQRGGMPAQQPQENAEIAQLRSEIQLMRAETTVLPMMQRFAAERPDYVELEPRIEAILKSGVVEQLYGTGLSPEQRLSEAYRMAGGSSPSRSGSEPAPAHSSAPTAPRPVNPDAGKKSVRGAPANGASPATDDDETDLEELLRKEYRRIAS